MSDLPADTTPPSSPRIGVLINRMSGRNRTGTQALDAFLASRPDIPVQRPDRPEATAAALAALAAQGVNVLAICGGDGTVQQALNLLLSPATPFARLPPIAILPGGTTNMIAHDINEARRPLPVLRTILRHAAAGSLASRVAARPVMRLSGGDAPTPAYGFFFGAAGIYDATMQNRATIDRMGVRDSLGPALRLLIVLFRIAIGRDPFPPVPMGLALDGKPYGEKPVIALLASTLDRLVLGVVPFWGADAGPIRLTTVFAHAHSVLRAVFLALRSRPHKLLRPENGYDSFNSERIELAFDGPCVLDGEMFHASRARPIMLEAAGTVSFLRG
ncbi:MAG: diacylglycerol kinase family protein [Reyranellaceae bacterium]